MVCLSPEACAKVGRAVAPRAREVFLRKVRRVFMAEKETVGATEDRPHGSPGGAQAAGDGVDGE